MSAKRITWPPPLHFRQLASCEHEWGIEKSTFRLNIIFARFNAIILFARSSSSPPPPPTMSLEAECVAHPTAGLETTSCRFFFRGRVLFYLVISSNSFEKINWSFLFNKPTIFTVDASRLLPPLSNLNYFPEDPFLVIPKFDRLAVVILFYMWWMLSGIASTEG